MRKYFPAAFFCVLGFGLGFLFRYILVPPVEVVKFQQPTTEMMAETRRRKNQENLSSIGLGEAHGLSFILLQGSHLGYHSLDWFLFVRNTGIKYIAIDPISSKNFFLTNQQGQSLKISASSEGTKLAYGNSVLIHLVVEKPSDTSDRWNFVFQGLNTEFGNVPSFQVNDIKFALK